jgi:hypothetical protein
MRRRSMCDVHHNNVNGRGACKTIPVAEAVGMVLAHDITEIRKDEFKGRAFKKGHVVREEDICHLQRLGKERLYVLSLGPDEMHEDEAAYAIAAALMGEGVEIEGKPREGKINIVAARDGLLKVNREALLAFNMLGEVMCATRHGNTLVKKGRVVAGTRAIPLVIKRALVDEAVRIGERVRTMQDTGFTIQDRSHHASCIVYHVSGVIEVKELRKPKAGVVITGNEVYYGRIKDVFGPVIREKIEATGGEITGMYYAPDDARFIEERFRELLDAGADLLIATGGMSVDPDDVTRFAVRNLGATDLTYGSAVLPGAMVLVGYIQNAEWRMRNAELKKVQTQDAHSEFRIPNSELIPILGIPACGMYHKITVLDLILPRVLAGERIGRRELAELGHGGLCLNCRTCRFPVCPFGK